MHGTLATHLLGPGDLDQRLPGGAHREEEVGIGVPADRLLAPRVVGVREGEAQMEVNYALEPWELKAGYVLTCQARPTSEKVVVDYDHV